MSSVVISGDTSGAITVAAPTTAGTSTLTLPTGASGTIAAQGVSTNIVSGTAVASTSGTSIDFTSIPSWVRRITVNFDGVSTNSASLIIVQIGGASVETSSYISAVTYAGAATGTLTSTTGFIANPSSSAVELFYGTVVLNLLNSSTNNWCSTTTGTLNQSGGWYSACGGGTKAITGSLQRVRITTVSGTGVFDAGSINILYE
jgi:hypothetical protein